MDTNIKEANIEFQDLLKKKAKTTTINLFIRIGIVIVIFVMLGIYLFSPVSSLKNTRMNGNIYFNKEDILNLLNHNENDSLFKIDEKLDENLLNEHPLIENSDIKIKPFGVDISFDECAPSAKYGDEIYHTLGMAFTQEEFNNQIIADYFSEHNFFFANYLSTPETVSKEYNARLLKITAFSNKSNSIIHFVDVDKNEKTLIFYYFVDSNLPLLRVNFNCEDKISSEDFSKIITKDVIQKSLDLLNSKDRVATEKKFLFDNVEYTYFDTDLSFNYEGKEVFAQFNYR